MEVRDFDGMKTKAEIEFRITELEKKLQDPTLSSSDYYEIQATIKALEWALNLS
jgi:hypothetical protein